jgi:DNA polymerase
MSKEEKLKQIKEEVINCKKCSLYKTRTLPVIGQGSHNAKIMFIGEAPGANEDKTGIPFCGKSGDFLDEMLNKAGIKREDVYICNLLKCRPPKNRDPNQKELKVCTPYLDRQIELIKPKVISSLGRYSMEFLMKKYGLEDQMGLISKIHGNVFEVKTMFSEIKLVPLYHPAVAVYNANMKDVLIEDFKALKNI